MPLYHVIDNAAPKGDPARSRLVMATKPAGAVRHVVADRFTVSTPDPIETHRLAKQGVEIETAGADNGEEAGEGVQQPQDSPQPQDAVQMPQGWQMMERVEDRQAGETEIEGAVEPRRSIIDEIEGDAGGDRLSDAAFYGRADE